MSKNNTSELEEAWQQFERPNDDTTFQHYKGGFYEIITTGFLEETLTPCVVYRSQENGLVWVRTAENFFDHIEQEGNTVSRFTNAS